MISPTPPYDQKTAAWKLHAAVLLYSEKMLQTGGKLLGQLLGDLLGEVLLLLLDALALL